MNDPQNGLSSVLHDAAVGVVESTIQDVANAAGVSKTTVSHVLSGNRPVSAKTKRRVEKVMAELAFQPNYFAQALTSKRSNSIALIVQDLTNPFYPALARGLQAAVASLGQTVMLFDAGAGSDLSTAFVDASIQRRVDGMVLAASGLSSQISRLKRAGIPVVAVGSGLAGQPLDWVSADDAQMAADAASFLHSSGRRRLATIAGPASSAPGKARLSGFLACVNNLAPTFEPQVVVADFTKDGGYAAMGALLESGNRPDAVFCANDLMAIGAMQAAHSAGLSIPGDVAFIGVDDIDAAALVRPALTTVHIPVQEIGRAAGELLLHRISVGSASAHRHVQVDHHIVIRESA